MLVARRENHDKISNHQGAQQYQKPKKAGGRWCPLLGWCKQGLPLSWLSFVLELNIIVVLADERHRFGHLGCDWTAGDEIVHLALVSLENRKMGEEVDTVFPGSQAALLVPGSYLIRPGISVFA